MCVAGKAPVLVCALLHWQAVDEASFLDLFMEKVTD